MPGPIWRRLLRLACAAGVLAGCTTLRAPVAPGPAPAQAWAEVLRDHVDDQGHVDFGAIANDPANLESYVASVAQTAPGALPTRQDQLAFYINSYNALAMYGVVRAGIPSRLSLLGRADFFKLTSFVVGGRPISLYDYENDVIRPFGDERVHFALNCMAVSCPRLPRLPFQAAAIDRELDDAARLFFSEPRNVRADPARRVVFLSAILGFYTEDFLRKAPTLTAYVNRYRAEPIPLDYRVEFFDYDWTINRQ